MGAEDAGGQIHGPEHQQGGVRVDALSGENAIDLGLVPKRENNAERTRRRSAPSAVGFTSEMAISQHPYEAGNGVRFQGNHARVRR